MVQAQFESLPELLTTTKKGPAGRDAWLDEIHFDFALVSAVLDYGFEVTVQVSDRVNDDHSITQQKPYMR